MHAATTTRSNDIEAHLLAQGDHQGQEVAQHLSDFLAGAKLSLDMATYDFRLSGVLAEIVSSALHERQNAGVAIRIAYDADKPEYPAWEEGMDPAPAGTGYFVQSLGLPWRRIGGPKLMHHKYIIRDAGSPQACVWTGSTNLTDNAFTLQENNIVILYSSELARYYSYDFEELWQTQVIGNSGDFDTSDLNLFYQGQPVRTRLLFSPGRGTAIDYEVARRVAEARQSVRICSMLLNSGALLSALNDLLRIGKVEVSGIYDQTQMTTVLSQWQDVPHNHWKIDAVRDIVQATGLAGKKSTPYQPDSIHDFMHNKIIVVDDTVITGSYNFSHSAQLNAENILMLENAELATKYSQYIDYLAGKYR